MILRATLFSLISWATLYGQSKAPAAKFQTVTVCELLSSPLRYDGRFVRIRDRMVGTSEGAWFKGYDCPEIMQSDGYKWPTLVSLARPESKQRLHDVDFEYDEQAERKLNAKYKSNFSKLPYECLLFTYSGVFETRQDWTKWKVISPNGSSRFVGFGHLGNAPAQLIIKSPEDVEAIPNCSVRRSRP